MHTLLRKYINILCNKIDNVAYPSTIIPAQSIHVGLHKYVGLHSPYFVMYTYAKLPVPTCTVRHLKDF